MIKRQSKKEKDLEIKQGKMAKMESGRFNQDFEHDLPEEQTQEFTL